MDDYQYIIKNSLRLVALFIFAVNSYVAIPQEILRFILLVLSSGFLIYTGIEFNCQKSFFKTMFTWVLTAWPWAFYILMLCVFKRTESNLELIMSGAPQLVICYNLFRYFLLIVVFIIFLKEFFASIRDLYSR